MNTLTAHPLTTINYWDALRVKMVIRRYSAPTIRAYLSQVRIFAQSIRPMEPGDVSLDALREDSFGKPRLFRIVTFVKKQLQPGEIDLPPRQDKAASSPARIQSVVLVHP